MKMMEYDFGDIDHTHLRIRLYASPRIFSRYAYDFRACYFPRGNHRCYCPHGFMLDGRIVVFGFGVTWFLSHYNGEIPCTCDRALAEIRKEAARDKRD